MIADRAEHLRRRGEPRPPVLLALAKGARHAGREPRQRLRPLAASPGEQRRLARERPAGGVRRPARPFDEHRPEPGQTADEPPHALALASEQRARRMAGETPRQPRRPQRALVDACAHPRGQRLRRAVEALARLSDDRLAPRQRAGERPEIGAQALGEAQDRAAAASVEVGERGEELGAHRHGEFGRRGRRRRAQVRRVIDAASSRSRGRRRR